MIRGEVNSYRQLPVRLYQIQTKFRDEIRPRFGLMRGREFIMKDAYSFDVDVVGAEQSYQSMYQAYKKIFQRLGVKFRAVEADNGSIGGSFSHEFMVLADTGEDTIVFCNDCEHAANMEQARVRWSGKKIETDCPACLDVSTPNAHTVSEVSALLGVPPTKIIKTLIFSADGTLIATLVRGDRELNEVKLKNLLGVQEIHLAGAVEVERLTHAPLGFAGPRNLNVPIYADLELQGDSDYITGGNAADCHTMHIDLSRDVHVTAFADLRNITPEDLCPQCGGRISLKRGIEVGHVFMLGLKYSDAMHAVFLDEKGRERLMVMGCYGIGVSRIAAAAIEQNNDADGIVFPPPIAPFDCILIGLDSGNDVVTSEAEKIYALLKQMGIDVLYDDRNERPGVKFKDADLLGIPLQLVIGSKSLARRVVECKDRRSGEKGELDVDNLEVVFRQWADHVHKQWKMN
jgi:prolyl-tRNA synthetase